MLDISLELAFQAQLLFVYGIGQEVTELLGHRQGEAFFGEILLSIPTVRSVPELQKILQQVAQKSNHSSRSYQLNTMQMRTLHQTSQRLAVQYLGKEYAADLTSVLFKQMPANSRQHLFAWFENSH